MKENERIPVYMRIINGKTACICHVSQKRCKMPCERGTVSRNRFKGWQQVMHRDKYGK